VTTLESSTERLEDALRRLAVEAADLFEELLASGAELPFDLDVSEGEGPLPMYSYSPMTGKFIRDHIGELRRLEAYLEVRDLSSEEIAIGFLTGLWEGRSEFDVAGDRLSGAIDGAIASFGGSGEDDATPAGEVIVPLVGFHMPADELVLDGVRIVRANTLADAPADAVSDSGFLARVSCGHANVAPAAAVADDLQRTLRTLRLFRPGAVGLAPHGWARRADGWERFGTGAARTRNGGYRLTGSEVGELRDFADVLTQRGSRDPSLSWAISRFDLGAERASLIEGLSDFLLALRGLLEGGGKIEAGLSARVAVLACEPHERENARVCVERALKIERKLMSGARYRPTADASPLRVISDLEELLRRILNKLAAGELSGDLRERSDELLLAEGMTAASASPARHDETAEWQLPAPTGDDDEELDLATIADGHIGEVEVKKTSDGDETVAHEENGTHELSREDPTTRIVVTDVELPDIMGADEHPSAPPAEPSSNGSRAERAAEAGADWFASADGELEWPAFASPRRGREAEERPEKPSEDVRYLFPVPDQTDWEVGELRYERKRSS
jgi:hypothetical protein